MASGGLVALAFACAAPNAPAQLARVVDAPRVGDRCAAIDPAEVHEDGIFGEFTKSTYPPQLVDPEGIGRQVLLHQEGGVWMLLDRETDGRLHSIRAGSLPWAAGYRIFVADATRDGLPEGIFARSDALVVVDLRSGEILHAEVFAALPRPNSTTVTDIDGDGILEYLLAFDDSLTARPLFGGADLWTLPVGGRDLVVGDTDGDGAPELVILRDMVVDVIDLRTLATEWTSPGLERPASFDLTDLDGDGRDELVQHVSPSALVATDVDTGAEKWRTAPDVAVWSMMGARAVDAEGDGILELVVTGLSSIDLFDASTGAHLKSWYSLGDTQFMGMAWGDLDDDCSPEGYFMSGDDWAPRYDRVWEYDAVTGTASNILQQWQGPVRDMALGDVDADGRDELVRYSTLVGAPSPMLFVTDWPLRDQPPSEPGANLFGSQAGIALANIDADPQLEIALPWRGYRLEMVDWTSRATQWEHAAIVGSNIQAVVAVDVDRDGITEIAWSQGPDEPNSTGPGASVLVNGADGSDRWSHDEGGASRSLVVGDTDADGYPELIIGSGPLGVHVRDGRSGSLDGDFPVAGPQVMVVQGLDVDDDGDDDVVAGLRGQCAVVALDGRSGAEIWRRELCTIADTAASAIAAGDLDDDGREDLVVLSPDDSYLHRIHVLDRSSGAEIWTALVPETTAYYLLPGLMIDDIDTDGINEIVVGGSGWIKAYQCIVRPDVEPPSWDGGVGLATVRPTWSRSCCPAADLDWGPARDAQSGPVTYEVHRSTSRGFVPSLATIVARTPLTSWRDTGLTRGVEYCYVVRATDARGNSDANRLERRVMLAPAVPPSAPQLLEAVDVDPCDHSGIRLTFTHDGLPEGVTVALLMDGNVVLDGVVSPLVHVPGDDQPHAYAIRATHPSCPLHGTSTELTAADAAGLPAAPTGVSIVDPNACAAGSAQARFTHPGFAPLTGHFELLQDGRNLGGIVDGGTFDPGDSAWHSYVVAAVSDACGAAPSAPFVHRDRSGCEPDDVVLFVARAASALRLTWNPADGGASYDAYVGSLGSLRSGAYDHVAQGAGLGFPDAVDVSLGCDVSSGSATTARVSVPDGEDTYFLVVAVSPTGVGGSFGWRSDLVDRRDPAVEPRPAATFCR